MEVGESTYEPQLPLEHSSHVINTRDIVQKTENRAVSARKKAHIFSRDLCKIKYLCIIN
jgi:hypothetical protein